MVPFSRFFKREKGERKESNLDYIYRLYCYARNHLHVHSLSHGIPNIPQRTSQAIHHHHKVVALTPRVVNLVRSVPTNIYQKQS